MRTTQHGTHLTQLTAYRMMNAYLVREEDGFTLVDSMINNQADAILTAANSLGTPIKRILLTHAHIDHAGAVDSLAAKLPGVEFICSPQSAEFMQGNLALRSEQPQGAVKGDMVAVTTKPTRLVNEGDRVGSLRVVESPGHTPAHLSFIDERDGTLIAGDAIVVLGGVVVPGSYRSWFPLPATATWHWPSAVKSAQKLLALQPKRLAVGHGRVIENPQAILQQAVARAERTL